MIKKRQVAQSTGQAERNDETLKNSQIHRIRGIYIYIHMYIYTYMI